MPVYVTVVPPLGTPLTTVTPLICSVGPNKVAEMFAAVQVNPVLVPVSTIFTVLSTNVSVLGAVINPELVELGVDVAFTAIFQVLDDGTALVKASVPALTVVAPE